MHHPETAPKKPTILERIRANRPGRKTGDDRGLVLLDVLFGIALFALVVLTAIQEFGAMRLRTYETRVMSDAQQLAIGIEQHISDNGALPADAAAVIAALPDLGVNLSDGNVVDWFLGDAATSAYVICIQHETSGTADAAAIYESVDGAITAHDRKVSCGATPATYAAAQAATLS